MYDTIVRPARDLRNNYAEIAQIVRENNHVIITNQGRGDTVLISMDEYKKYEEFIHFRYVSQKLEEAEMVAESCNPGWKDDSEVLSEIKQRYGL